MAKQIEIILIKDHSALGKKDTIVKMLDSNVEAWLNSGYAKLKNSGAKEPGKSGKKKGSKK